MTTSAIADSYGEENMKNPTGLEEAYKEFIHHLPIFLPDGIIDVDLALLHENNILGKSKSETHEDIKHYFHIIETQEKITLFNDDFVIWIVPQSFQGQSITLTLVAHISTCHKTPNLELAFTNAGVYNTSQIVLQVLEHFLEEIKENNLCISGLDKEA